MQTFHTNGVDIIINKEIPVSGGLGGSSADAVAVLIGMNKLYKVGAALKPLADALGSDTGYMLSGGYATISGRGDLVTKIDTDKTLYLLLIAEDTGITARECYKLYDSLNLPIINSTDKR
jgi:4-diphosphocytidyl-2-C-methyl-D-erythritol kinase